MNDAERIRVASANDIAALLGGGLHGDLVEKLTSSPRFAARLHAAARCRLGDLSIAEQKLLAEQNLASTPAAAALALAPDSLSDIVLRAGAVWHAAAIARVVDTAARRGLMATLGPDVYAIALEGRGLAPAVEPIVPPEGDGWAEAAMRDGARCWSAWRALQPPAVASRLALLGFNSVPARIHTAFGPAIVDRLLDRS
jgi:hypothetical protein